MRNKVILGDISRFWWMPFLAGLISIGLGIWTLCGPTTSIPFMAIFFAVCLCVAGVLNLGYSISLSRYNDHWGWSCVVGILDIVAGVWLFCLPEPALSVSFLIIVGIWILCIAINSICEACVISSYSPAGIFLMVLLLMSTIILAIICLSNPLLAGYTIWLLLGIGLICYGISKVALSFQVKKITSDL